MTQNVREGLGLPDGRGGTCESMVRVGHQSRPIQTDCVLRRHQTVSNLKNPLAENRDRTFTIHNSPP